jgi:hypothetical protein
MTALNNIFLNGNNPGYYPAISLRQKPTKLQEMEQ